MQLRAQLRTLLDAQIVRPFILALIAAALFVLAGAMLWPKKLPAEDAAAPGTSGAGNVGAGAAPPAASAPVRSDPTAPR